MHPLHNLNTASLPLKVVLFDLLLQDWQDDYFYDCQLLFNVQSGWSTNQWIQLGWSIANFLQDIVDLCTKVDFPTDDDPLGTWLFSSIVLICQRWFNILVGVVYFFCVAPVTLVKLPIDTQSSIVSVDCSKMLMATFRRKRWLHRGTGSIFWLRFKVINSISRNNCYSAKYSCRNPELSRWENA